MPIRSWSKPLFGSCACLLASWVQAQAPAHPLPADANASATTTVAADRLQDALLCHTPVAEIAALLPNLRRERPDDFVQVERQYSQPAMDVYRLQTPVQAWGQQSDAIVLTRNRVLMLVQAPLESVAATLEEQLEQTPSEPLAGALDDHHALVIYAGEQPGLQGRVLLGCEYRVPDLSLLDDPADAWRQETHP